MRTALAALLTPLVLAGCGGSGSSSDEAAATPRSLAALVLQHVPLTAVGAYDASSPTNVGTTVLLGRPDRPDVVQVSVERVDQARADLQRSICVNCDVTEPDQHTTLQVSRGDRLPRAGVGTTRYVTVTRIRDHEIVMLAYEGRPIQVHGKGTKGRLDVETLVDIVLDPGMGLTTVRGLIDQGEHLTVWTTPSPRADPS